MPTYKTIARNYATDHTNRIHSDDTARVYGFAGALVPGVGVYSYMIEPVVATFGDEWLSRGAATVKFLKPVYDGSEVTVEGHLNEELSTLEIQLHDSSGTLCAVAEAHLQSSARSIQPADYPHVPMPPTESRREPAAAAVPKGDVLGSLEGTFDPERLGADFGPAVRRPAVLLALANDIVAGNVVLGPWIHTASGVEHFALLETDEPFSLRGYVEDSGQKRGHDFITLQLALFGLNDRPIARISHSALIRLREIAAPQA